MKEIALTDGLPQEFVERIKSQFPEDQQEILKTFSARPPVVRVNGLLISSEELLRQLKSSGIETSVIPELPNACLVKNADRKTLTSLEAYEQGGFYIQSIASQLVVQVLDPQPGEKILDLCAAPGSKTTQIAIAMKKKGELIANEPNKDRFFRLLANLKQQRLDDFVICKKYLGERYGKYYREYFDRVLVDAPCSSEARFDRQDEKSIRYWSRHKIKALSRLQKKLLLSAVNCVKKGGTIVYSTCTFAPEENELLLNNILKKHPEVSLLAISYQGKKLPIIRSWKEKEVSDELQSALRIFPDEVHEGFFIALLQKNAV